MDIKKAFAEMQLKGCFIEKIQISNDFYNISNENLNISMDLKNGISDIICNEKSNHLEANLALDLTIFAESNNDNTRKYTLNIVINGLFDYGGSEEKEFYNMLLLNGNSTLYSIARSHIITLTSMSSQSGQIIIPMINFAKLLEETEKENPH